MTLTVETGTGSASSDALVSLAAATTYHAAQGNALWAAGDDADKETSIRRATGVLNGYAWQGYRVNGRDQSLAWPRYNVSDREGYSIPSNEVPQEIVDACCELALRELVTPGTLTPDLIAGDSVKREKVGSLEVEYASPAMSLADARTQVSIVGPLIGQFLKHGSGSTLAGASYRV